MIGNGQLDQYIWTTGQFTRRLIIVYNILLVELEVLNLLILILETGNIWLIKIIPYVLDQKKAVAMFALVPRRKFEKKNQLEIRINFLTFFFMSKCFFRFTISKGQGPVFGSFVSENYKGCGLSDQIESGYQDYIQIIGGTCEENVQTGPFVDRYCGTQFDCVDSVTETEIIEKGEETICCEK